MRYTAKLQDNVTMIETGGQGRLQTLRSRRSLARSSAVSVMASRLSDNALLQA